MFLDNLSFKYAYILYNLPMRSSEDHDLKDSYLFYKFTTDLEFSCSRADDDFDYSIDAIFNDFKTVEIKDRAFHLKTYKNCFVGREAVDLLVATGHAQSRDDAVRIGCILGSDLNYFGKFTSLCYRKIDTFS